MSLQFCKGREPTNGRHDAPGPWAPFPSCPGAFSSEGRIAVKGGVCRRSVPLTAILPSVQSNPRERGPGVSGGSSPWRSMRQRLMRAPARHPTLSLLSPFRNLFSARFSCAPVSPCFHPHSVVAVATTVHIGVLNTRGAAISATICGVPVSWCPTISRDLAVTPTRRFRLSRRFRSVFKALS
jgi:hypothetical protein